jgi:nuclear mRNA export protein PCID2/THP1
MAFGDPTPPWPQAPAAAANATANHLPQHFSQTAPFTSAFILEDLRALNKIGEPELDEAQLERVRDWVLPQVTKYIGLPVLEVLEKVNPILVRSLCEQQSIEPLRRITEPPRRKAMAMPPLNMQTAARLGHFLLNINGFIEHRNESQLAAYIVLEPPFNPNYLAVIGELKQFYPKGSEDALEQKCTQDLKAAVAGDDGSPWTTFIKFMAPYLSYLRDVSADVNRYLETYELLSELQQKANSALGHSTLGHLMLPVVVANAKLVCRLAIGLDKQPGLIAHLKSGQAGGEDGGPRETLPERAANILRGAFVTCLNDRVSGLSAQGQPEGKKRGIYTIANLCLKILFQCRKTRNATQIFENIYNLSPPLSAYPKRERVTFLYYLGRFLFQNSHFYRAQRALQQAYNECPVHPSCLRQRRHILVYLITSNITLGRFPSQELLSRPEAQGFDEKFLPLCFAIRSGNLAAFRDHLDFTAPHAPWFLHFRILLQLRNRCEPLVWRSLVRKTWNLVGTRPDPATRLTPTVTFGEILEAFRFASKAQGEEEIDPDFLGVEYGETTPELDITAMMSKLSSLLDQGLLNGFLAHKVGKYCITGVSKASGNILAAGFPEPWTVLEGKVESQKDGNVVPGWKIHASGPAVPGFGGGVMRLSGLREIGAA